MTTLTRTLQRSIAIAAIAAAGFTAGSVTAPDTAAADNNIGLPTVPLVIVNKSGSAQNLYVYVQGTYKNKYYYVSDTNGDVARIQTSSGGTYKPFGINLGTKPKTKIFIPQLPTARIYLSFGNQMQINVKQGGAAWPSGWSTTDPNYNTMFDWVEYTWAADNSLNANLTQVQAFGIPLFVAMKGKSGPGSSPVTVAKAGFAKAGTRSKIISAMSSAAAPWNGLIVSKNGTSLRVLSPYNGMVLGKFPTDQLDQYIDSVYTTYASGSRAGQKLTAVVDTGTSTTFTGQVTGGNLVFTQSGRTTPVNTVTFPKPTSYDAYAGPSYTVSNAGNATLVGQAGLIAHYVQAALMRTTMLSYSTITDCPTPGSAYYKKTPVNIYAKTMHQYGYRNLAYAFADDEACNQSSDITVYSPTSMTITVPPFSPPSKKKRR